MKTVLLVVLLGIGLGCGKKPQPVTDVPAVIERVPFNDAEPGICPVGMFSLRSVNTTAKFECGRFVCEDKTAFLLTNGLGVPHCIKFPKD